MIERFKQENVLSTLHMPNINKFFFHLFKEKLFICFYYVRQKLKYTNTQKSDTIFSHTSIDILHKLL